MNNIQVKLHNNKELIETYNVSDRETLILQAQKGCNYELLNMLTNAAPQNIIAKRSGQDLLIILDENEGIGSPDEIQPDILIKGYYGEAKGEDGDTDATGILIGLHENGKYYAYIPESGEVNDAISILADEMAEPQAIGGDELECGPLPFFFPWWALLQVMTYFLLNDEKPAPVDQNPIANNDTLTNIPTGKKAVFDVVANDSDPDNNLDPTTVKLIDPVTGEKVTKIVVPNEGEWEVNPVNGKVTFTPNPNFVEDPTPVKYTVKDTTGLESNEATIKPDYVVYQTDPVSIEDKGTAPEDTPIKGNVLENDIDKDGDVLKVKDFTVDTDGDGELDTVFKPGTTAVIKDVGTLIIDEDGDYVFTPVKDFNGPVPAIEYTVIDEDGQTDPTKVTLTITPVDDAPVAEPDIKSTPKGTPVTIDVTNNDSDPDDNLDPKTVKLIDPNTKEPKDSVTIPDEGTYTVEPDGKVTFDPDPKFTGETSITYIVSDDTDIPSEPAIIKVTVAEGAVPETEDDSKTTKQNTPVSGNVLDNDTDADPKDTLTVKEFIVDGKTIPAGETAEIPNVGKLVINKDGSYTFTPEPTFTGKVPEVTYIATDGKFNEPATLTLTVDGVPDAVDDDFSVPKDEPSIIKPLPNDTHPDDDTLKIVDATVPPEQGKVVVNDDGTLTFTPNPTFDGEPEITYTVEDENGDKDTAKITLTLIPNKPPVAQDNNVLGKEDDPSITGNVITDKSPDGKVDNDPDGTIKGVTKFITPDGVEHPAGEKATIPNVGTIVINKDGSYEFVPEENYFGKVPEINYTIEDDKGLSDDANLTITVAPRPDAPIPDNNAITVREGETQSLDLTAPIDVDSTDEQLTIIVKDLPEQGIIKKADGTPVKSGDTLTVEELKGLTFTAPDDYVKGSEIGDFTYDVVDETGTHSIELGGVEFAVSKIIVSDGQAVEGDNLTHKVELTIPTERDEVYSFTLTDGDADGTSKPATAGEDFSNLPKDIKFTNGVTLNDDGTITIPKGVSKFEVSYPTIQDNAYEISETTKLIIGGEKAKGTIVDEDDQDPKTPNDKKDGDKPTLKVSPAEAKEGENLEFDITLSNPVAEETTLALTTIFDAIPAITAETDDIKPPFKVTYTENVNGKDVVHTIAANDNGTFTIPAGVTNLKASVLAVDDPVYEIKEFFTLKGDVTLQTGEHITDKGLGTISDENAKIPNTNDPDPKKPLEGDKPELLISDAEAKEDENLDFELTLTHPVEAETKLTLTTLFDPKVNPEIDSAAAGDIQHPFFVKYLDKQGNKHTISQNDDGTYTIPAKVTKLQVSILAIDDHTYEVKEDFVLKGDIKLQDDSIITGKGNGIILDENGRDPNGKQDPNKPLEGDKPKLIISDDQAIEGEELEFNITLTNKVGADTTLTLKPNFDETVNSAIKPDIKNIAEQDDIDLTTLVVSFKDKAGKIQTISANDDGTFTIPEGVTHLKAKVLAKTDNLYEIKEKFTLDGEVKLQDDKVITDTGIGVIVDIPADKPQLEVGNAKATEGEKLKFTIDLTHPVEADTTLKLTPIFDPTHLKTAEIEDITLPFEVKYTEKVGDKDIEHTIAVNEDGTFTVPKGITHLTAETLAKPDGIFEIKEDFVLKGELTLQDGEIIDDTGDAIITDADATDPNTGEIIPHGADKPTLTVGSDEKVEGKNLEFNITLSNKVDAETTLTLTPKFDPKDPNSAEIDDITLPFIVTYEDKVHNTQKVIIANDDGTYTIPKNITHLKATTMTEVDGIFEIKENFTLEGKVTLQDNSVITDEGKGVILDKDGKKPDGTVDPQGADRPTLDIQDAQAVEGNDLIFDIALSNKVDAPTTLKLTPTFDPAVTPEIDPASLKDMELPFIVSFVDENNKTQEIEPNQDGTFTIPANVTHLKAEVLAKHDGIFERKEDFVLEGEVTLQDNSTINAKATGLILDPDGKNPDGTVDPQGGDKPALIVGDAKAKEGDELEFAVTLTHPVGTETTLTLTPNFDPNNPNSAEMADIVPAGQTKPNFTLKYTEEVNGKYVEHTITANDDGTFTIPAEVTHLTASVPTTPDETYETLENFTLTGKVELPKNEVITDDGNAQITDEDKAKPELTIDAPEVNEGEPLIFNVKLTHPVDGVTELKLNPVFNDPTNPNDPNTASDRDVTLPLVLTYVDEKGETQTIKPNSKGIYEIPPMVTDLQAKFETVTDNVYEISEAFTLEGSAELPNESVITASNKGTINDKDSDKPQISITADPKVTTEGDDKGLVYTVAIDNDKVSVADSIVHVKPELTVDTTDADVKPEDIKSITYTDVDGKVQTVINTAKNPTAIQDFFDNGVDVKIAKGETTAPAITIVSADDTLAESTIEHLQLTISHPKAPTAGTDGYTLGTKDAVGDIVDNDKVIVNLVGKDTTAVDGLSLVVGNASVIEGQDLVFDVNLTMPVAEETTLSLEKLFKNGTGFMNGGDVTGDVTVTYIDEQGNPQTLTTTTTTYIVPANITALQVAIATRSDTDYEGLETMQLGATLAINNQVVAADIGIGSIIDQNPDDTTPVVAPTAVAKKVEDNKLIFEVNQTMDSSTNTTAIVKLDLGTVEREDIKDIIYNDGTTDTPIDIDTFINTGHTVTISAHSDVKPTFTIVAEQDSRYEKSETLSLTMTTVTGAEKGEDHAIGTIYDQKGSPKVPPVDPNDPNPPVTPPNGDMPVVMIKTRDGVAIEPKDANTPTDDTILFEISQTTVSDFDTTVKVVLDLYPRDSANKASREDISKIVFDDGLNNSDSVRTLTDAEFDALIDPTKGMTITIPKNSDPSDSTAVKPTFKFWPAYDEDFERYDQFTMTLSEPTEARVSDTQYIASGMIKDKSKYVDDDTLYDEPILTIKATDPSAIEGAFDENENADVVVFTISKNRNSSFDTTANVTIDMGSGDEGLEMDDISMIIYSKDGSNDPEQLIYFQNPTQINRLLTGDYKITIPAGSDPETFKPTFTIVPQDDYYKENVEKIKIKLTNIENADPNEGQHEAEGQILDDPNPGLDDIVFVKITVDKAVVQEIDMEKLTYIVELVNINGEPVPTLPNESVDVQLQWSGGISPVVDPNTGIITSPDVYQTIIDGKSYKGQLPRTITIEGGKSQKSFVVQIDDDSTNEVDEQIIPVIEEIVSAREVADPSSVYYGKANKINDGNNNTFEILERHSTEHKAKKDLVSATTKIKDNDVVYVTAISDEAEPEGNALVHKVRLNTISTTTTAVNMNITGPTATIAGDKSNTVDGLVPDTTVNENGKAYVEVSFDNGDHWKTVEVEADGSFDVDIPDKIGGFLVKVPTQADWIAEGPSEFYTIGGQIGDRKVIKAIGTIKDFEWSRVSEEGILVSAGGEVDGLEDNQGEFNEGKSALDGEKADTTDLAHVESTFGFVRAVKEINYIGERVTSDGNLVDWNWNAQEQALIGTIDDKHDLDENNQPKEKEVLRIQLDKNDTDFTDGIDYEILLKKGLDHEHRPDQIVYQRDEHGEFVLDSQGNKIVKENNSIEDTLDLKFEAIDMNNEKGDFAIVVEDDSPNVKTETGSQLIPSKLLVNVMVCIDLSASMDYDLADNEPTIHPVKLIWNGAPLKDINGRWCTEDGTRYGKVLNGRVLDKLDARDEYGRVYAEPLYDDQGRNVDSIIYEPPRDVHGNIKTDANGDPLPIMKKWNWVENPDHDGTSRLDVAKAAFIKLMNTYEQYGTVRVKIVGFATKAGILTPDRWVDVNEAIDIINNMKAQFLNGEFIGSGAINSGENNWPRSAATNYDAALAAMQEAFDKDPSKGYLDKEDVYRPDGTIETTFIGANEMYFLTDGNPSQGDGNDTILSNAVVNNSDKGIQSAEQIIWENFLKANKIKSHAVSFTEVPLTEKIEAIAFNGVKPDDTEEAIHALHAKSAEALDHILQQSISVTPVSSNVVNSIYATGTETTYGGDNASITAIKMAGRRFLYDAQKDITTDLDTNETIQGSIVKVITEEHQSKFEVDLKTGGCIYLGSSEVAFAGGQEEFTVTYVLTDKDGDYDTASRTFIFKSEKTLITTPTLEIEANKNPNEVHENGEKLLEYKARYVHGGISTSNTIFNVKPIEYTDPDSTISDQDGNVTEDDVEYVLYTDISTGKQVKLEGDEKIKSFFKKGINIGIQAGKTAADTIEVKLKDDNFKEKDEVLELQISEAEGVPELLLNYELSKTNNTAAGRVIDDDLSPAIESIYKSVTEASGTTISGAAQVTQPQSVETLTVNDIEIYNKSNPITLPKEFKGDEGTLVITGYNPTTGLLSYTYTEDGNAEKHNVVGDDVYDEFFLSGTDSLGIKIYDDAANLGHARLIVQITDTVPSAQDDEASVREESKLTVEGNMLSNDTDSADKDIVAMKLTGVVADTINTSHVPDADPEELSDTVGLVVQGTYGTLTVYPDGRYTYVLDNDNEVVQALDNGDFEIDRFTYTITDADGDKATKHLLITVNGTDDVVIPQAHDDSWYNADYGKNLAGERTFAIDVITNEIIDGRGKALKQVTENQGADTDQDTPLKDLTVEIIGATKVFGSVYVLHVQDEGEWVVGVDGLPNHVIQFIPNKDFDGNPTPIQYRLHDGPVINGEYTGNTSEPATITLKMNPVIDITKAPVIANTAVVHVSEEGLEGHFGEIVGIADKEGDHDTTDSATNIATIELDNANKLQFHDIDSQPTTIGGTEVAWTLEPVEKKTLTAYIDTNNDGEQNANEIEVLRAELLGNDTVKATLLNEINHPDSSKEDSVSIDLAIKAINGGTKVALGKVTVVVEDDSIEEGVIVSNEVGHPFATNLIFALDISESMKYVPGSIDRLPTGHEKSRWEIARDGIRDLVKQYTADGHTVNIIMATFNDNVGPNSGWIQGATEDDVESFFGSVSLSGGTSYTAAVDNVITAFNQGEPHGDRTTIYTISDGNPESGSSLNEAQNAPIAKQWLEFLNDNNITDAHSYGFTNAENDRPVTVAELETLAYDAEKPHGADSGLAELINTETEFKKAIMDTVVEPVAGGYAFNRHDPLTGKVYNALGADGLDKILNIKYDFHGKTTTLTDDNNNHHIIVDTFFGKLEINTETGEYTYQTTNEKVKQYDQHIEKFTLEARDGDGDISHSVLEIHFAYDPASGHVSSYSTANVIDTFSTRSSDIDDSLADDSLDNSYVITNDVFADINDTSGVDSLVVKNTSGTLNLDFTDTTLQSKVSGINIIDLTQDGSDTSVKQVVVLDYDAVDAISENNELFVKADAEDLVKIDNAVKLDEVKVVDEVSYTAYDLNNDLIADVYINGGDIIL